MDFLNADSTQQITESIAKAIDKAMTERLAEAGFTGDPEDLRGRLDAIERDGMTTYYLDGAPILHIGLDCHLTVVEESAKNLHIRRIPLRIESICTTEPAPRKETP